VVQTENSSCRHDTSIHSFTRFNLSALLITDTEMKLVAAAAMINIQNKIDNGHMPPIIQPPAPLFIMS